MAVCKKKKTKSKEVGKVILLYSSVRLRGGSVVEWWYRVLKAIMIYGGRIFWDL